MGNRLKMHYMEITRPHERHAVEEVMVNTSAADSESWFVAIRPVLQRQSF